MAQVTVALPDLLLSNVTTLAHAGYRSRNQQIVMMLQTYVDQAASVSKQQGPSPIPFRQRLQAAVLKAAESSEKYQTGKTDQ